jgi:hypothetical protein
MSMQFDTADVRANGFVTQGIHSLALQHPPHPLRYDVSFNHLVVGNRNTPKSKAASAWAMKSRKWNDPQFFPTSVSTDLHSDYKNLIVIDNDVVADMAPVTLEKVKEKWAFA